MRKQKNLTSPIANSEKTYIKETSFWDYLWFATALWAVVMFCVAQIKEPPPSPPSKPSPCMIECLIEDGSPGTVTYINAQLEASFKKKFGKKKKETK